MSKTKEQSGPDIAAMLNDKDVSDLEATSAPEELRGMTPDDLSRFIEILDAHLRAIHQDDNGELRDKSEAETKALAYGLKLRERAMARLEEHRAIADVFKRRPKSVEQAIFNASYSRDFDDPYADVRRMPIGEARDRALRVVDTDRTAIMHLASDQVDQLERVIRKDTDIARRVLVTENEAYRNAWMKAVTDPQGAALWTDDERRAMQAFYEYRAMSEGTSAAGGFGVPVFIDPSIILTAQGSGNPFLQIAKQVPLTTNAWKGVTSAGVTWSFGTEASTVGDSSPTLAQPAVSVFLAKGFIPFSIEVGQDYPGFAEEMATLLGEGYDELLVDKFSRGSGSNEPTGILTALDADTTAEVLMGTAGTLAELDIYNAWKALPQRFRGVPPTQAGPGVGGRQRGASWMMSVGVNNAIRRFGTANVFHASTINLQDEWVDRLFNRQVFESPYFPDVVSTTAHTNQLVVGDFSNYVIARRGGMSVELVPHLVDPTNTAAPARPTGQRGWFAYARIGGGPATTAAFKLLNQT